MKKKLKEIVKKYGSNRSFLVPILQDIQREYEYLPREALNLLSQIIDVPISHIYNVATFYKSFSLSPRGRHQLSLCMGTACHVRRAPQIRDHLVRTLGINPGETTPDLEYTFKTVNCLGACALGPIMVVDGEYHGQLTIMKVNKILKELGKKERTKKKVAADEN
ncbi:MAG TPA: NAD(P)H-dependent oxidoreductase subunit E [Desulfotomaculum sp.]|nr:MAG: NADH dehydrogenase (Ubiquinone) 24 kDa subunit [Desulfotomaculum sp. 46_80]HAG10893.1 NAD(P)H-dependent oxidoreductase subunit E [Desulfotomaculum sp.]HBY04822.1 NAD(P)H-dependent oxidoreductase subunit E [Desulfotomaculum sp.]